jgi:hypothetical protein
MMLKYEKCNQKKVENRPRRAVFLFKSMRYYRRRAGTSIGEYEQITSRLAPLVIAT